MEQRSEEDTDQALVRPGADAVPVEAVVGEGVDDLDDPQQRYEAECADGRDDPRGAALGARGAYQTKGELRTIASARWSWNGSAWR